MLKAILIIACLILAAVFIWVEKKEHYVLAVVLKGLASLCFVLLGFQTGDGSHLARMIVAGLMVGAIADVLLNLRYVFRKKGQLAFLIGILVFMTGHILYICALWPLTRGKLVAVLAAILSTGALMALILPRITAKPAFKIFGIFYIGAIVLMNCVAASNVILHPGPFTGVFMTGAVLFLISDIVLILNTFGPKQRFPLRITNLMLYYIGQIFIAMSLMCIQF